MGLKIIAGTHCFQDVVKRNCAPGHEAEVYASFPLRL